MSVLNGAGGRGAGCLMASCIATRGIKFNGRGGRRVAVRFAAGSGELECN